MNRCKGAALFFLTGAALTTACVNDIDEGEVMGTAAIDGDAEQDQALFSTRCAGSDTVKGIDVSYYQGTIDWQRVRDDGVRFAFIRVSDGTGFVDSKFERNWREAKRAGVLRGAYQFFRPSQDPEAQADLLLSKMGALGPDDLPPVLDVEDAGGLSDGSVAARVRRWMARVESRIHKKPIVYTGPYFWRDHVGNADENDHLLWIAHYGTSCPIVPGTWTRWAFHQYTSSGRVSGISGNVDMNKWNGTLAKLRELTDAGSAPRACVTGRFDGAFCDDDGSGNEAAHDRLKRELDVDFHCADQAGSPAFCGGRKATRAQGVYVLGAAAGMPLSGHDNAFVDDNGHKYERSLNAAQDYGVVFGNERRVDPDGELRRSHLAAFLARMYRLPATDVDAFTDDDGSSYEASHNKVFAAGLMFGSVDDRGRRVFHGGSTATRSQLAAAAVRAFDLRLVPVWDIADECLDGTFAGSFCDDDDSTSAAAAHERAQALAGDVDVSCGELDGEPAFCGAEPVTRADAMRLLGALRGVPLAGHADGFVDDEGHPLEAFMDAAKAYGVFLGAQGGTRGMPDDVATRDALATMLVRIYRLPAADRDYFSDDDGAASEDNHNRAAAAGLFVGYDDGHGGKEFRGSRKATRDAAVTVTLRAVDAGLVPVWAQ